MVVLLTRDICDCGAAGIGRAALPTRGGCDCSDTGEPLAAATGAVPLVGNAGSLGALARPPKRPPRPRASPILVEGAPEKIAEDGGVAGGTPAVGGDGADETDEEGDGDRSVADLGGEGAISVATAPIVADIGGARILLPPFVFALPAPAPFDVTTAEAAEAAASAVVDNPSALFPFGPFFLVERDDFSREGKTTASATAPVGRNASSRSSRGGRALRLLFDLRTLAPPPVPAPPLGSGGSSFFVDDEMPVSRSIVPSPVRVNDEGSGGLEGGPMWFVVGPTLPTRFSLGTGPAMISSMPSRSSSSPSNSPPPPSPSLNSSSRLISSIAFAASD